MKSHTYKSIDARGARTLKCVECETAPATRKCEQCDDVYCRKCYQVVHSRGQRATHKYAEFKPGSLICVECDADFAVLECEDCGDAFCKQCSDKMHSKGDMRDHKLKDLDIWIKVILQEGEEYCSECNARVADRVCDQCSDPFCPTCYNTLHSKGLRQKHTWKCYHETGLASGWQEYWDEDEKKYVYFNTKTKKSQSCKPIELMALAERQKVERIQREEMQKQKMEDDIRDLQTRLEMSDRNHAETRKQLQKLEKEKEKRQKFRTAVKNGYREFKMKFMFGKKRRQAETNRDGEYLRETVLDKDYTKDVYKADILKEFSDNRAKLRHETFLSAKKDKERLKREELAAKLNDEGEGGEGLMDDELLS